MAEAEATVTKSVPAVAQGAALRADLGALSGPILLFGGPYSNLQATGALLDWADASGIPPERRICTGDVVAYCADPAATVARIRAGVGTVVAGNCEIQIGAGADDCGCGFEDGTTCSLLSRGWYPYALSQVAAEARRWMSGLPRMATLTHDGARLAVIHGGVRDVSRFLWPDSPEADFAAEFRAAEVWVGPLDGIIAGHCGLAFHREFDLDGRRRRWINAGAVGMPANDGDTCTRFAVLDDGQLRFHRLSYDHARAASAMRAAGLTQGYDEALLSGWWPSEDVLPPTLRRSARPQPLGAGGSTASG